MTNKERREIVNQAKEAGYQGSYVDLFHQHTMGGVGPAMGQDSPAGSKMATTAREREEGLRPAHAAGNLDESMSFPDTPPNTTFNTQGMRRNIDFTEVDNATGHIVKSYQDVPPGLAESFVTGTKPSTVIETPSKLRYGGRLGTITRK
jgi:hypothetical protein